MSRFSLERVTIDGFRGLRQLTLDGLGAITLLVGANNSGKTSVLEALSILCNPEDPQEWLTMVRRRDFGGLDETRIQSLRWCFTQADTLLARDPAWSYLPPRYEGCCEMTCDGRFPLRKLAVNYRDILREPVERETSGNGSTPAGPAIDVDFDEPDQGAEISHTFDLCEGYTRGDSIESTSHTAAAPVTMQFWENDPPSGRRPPPMASAQLPCQVLTPYSYQINTRQVVKQSQQLLSGAAASKSARSQLLALLALFDPEIVDIQIASFRGRRPAIYLSHLRLGVAPITVFGDGVRRAILLANSLNMLQGGGLLLIDEVETGIHVSALQSVFSWLAKAARELDVQIVATTHSLEAVDAIAESVGDRMEDLVTIHLEQKAHQTIGKRFSGDLLRRIREERGLDVR
ncbi:MAG: AAA family ATPase [Planctomycetota bacterium]|nr:AAA family ATPase [Planctomycetota bacterium]